MTRLKQCVFGLAFGLVFVQALAKEAEIQAPCPEGPLKGTIATTQNPTSPFALIVPGSGPIDRDGYSPLIGQTNTYKLLSEGLLKHGISTVRFDKRGMFGSAAALSDPNSVTYNDYASDVKTWISIIQKQTSAKCVWLIGHSEGGLVSLVAAQNSSDICGLVLVATAGRPLGLLLREQLKANPANAPILEEAELIINTLEAGHEVEASKISPALLSLFHPQIQGFLISGLTLDPARLITKIKKPILILQGLRDLQVNASDAKLLQNANPQAKLNLLENTNHVLKTVKNDDQKANIIAYTDSSLSLAEGVIDSISSFIAQKH